MSSNSNIYIGTYIKIEGLPKVKKIKEIVGCPKCESNLGRRASNYCPLCAHPIELYEKTIEEEYNIYEFQNNNQGLAIGARGTLIPNKDSCGGLFLEAQYLDDSELEIPPSSSIPTFMEVYEREIENLLSLGIKYRIVHGIVCYYS